MTTAVITGASGFLGGNLAEMLAADGVKVRATRRGSTSVAHVSDVPIDWVEAGLEVAALTRAFDGADVVFHCAAVPTQTRREGGPHRAANVDGTRAVLDACKAARVGRLVHVSSVVTCAIAKDGGPDVVESDAWNYAEHDLIEMYAVTKRESELLVLADKSVDSVVVNPGTMMGPRDPKPSSGRLLVALAKGQLLFAPRGFSSFVDVRDVCRGMIAAWHKGLRGERYILAGNNMSYGDAFALFARVLGVRGPLVSLPDLVVRLSGACGDLAEKISGRELDLNSAVTAYSVARGYRFSSAKAMGELGYTLSPLEDAVRDAAVWLREHGILPTKR